MIVVEKNGKATFYRYIIKQHTKYITPITEHIHIIVNKWRSLADRDIMQISCRIVDEISDRYIITKL